MRNAVATFLILASGTVAGTAAGVMTGWVMEQLRPAEIEAMCPLAEVVAALDGQTVYKVKTCEGATIWLQTPDLLSQGYP